MNSEARVAVYSRSFSHNPVLRAELLARYRQVTLSDAVLQLKGDSLIEFMKLQCKAITALEALKEYLLARLPKLIGKCHALPTLKSGCA